MTKILVISLAGIGDTLMATPLIHELRANFPAATIDVFVMWPASRELLEGNPHVNTILHKNLMKSGVFDTLPFFLQLRGKRYDVSINTYPQSRIEYRLVSRFIRARQRLSHIYDKWTILDRLLVNHATEQNYNIHAIENNLNLLKLLDASPRLSTHQTEITLKPEERTWADDFVRSDARKILGMHVGSGTTKNLSMRRWPLDYWIKLIEQTTAARPDARIFLFGGPDEVADHDQILKQVKIPAVRVASTRNFRETAALLSKCAAFISVDTSLMHLAAAMKVPRQIVIETPTFNKTVEPYDRPYTLVPNPMVGGRAMDFYRYDSKGIKGDAEQLKACMRSVTVESVLKAVLEALSSETSSPT